MKTTKTILKNIFPTFLLFTLCLSSVSSFGQKTDHREEVRALFWGANDKHANDTFVPEKWENESAVIIFQKILYQYRKLSKRRFVESESLRRRIKLQDQSAIDEYSEFTISNPYKDQKYSRYKWEKSIAELKIIKPDGTINEVDMSQAIKVDANGNTNAEKIAIPGLEPGDILDFYYYTGNTEYVLTSKSFNPLVSTLSAAYPIVEQELVFEIDNEIFFSAQVYNGAPQLKSVTSKDDDFKVYKMVDKDRAKNEDLRWYYSLREEPVLKSQVHLVVKDKYLDQWLNLKGNRGERQYSISKDELLQRYKEAFKFGSLSSANKNEYKNLLKTEKDKRKILQEVYDQERYDRVMRFLEPMTLIQEDIKPHIYDIAFSGFPTDRGMMGYMAKFCDELDIDFEVLVIARRDISELKDLLLEDEVEYLLKVNLEEPIYLSNWYVSQLGKWLLFRLQHTLITIPLKH